MSYYNHPVKQNLDSLMSTKSLYVSFSHDPGEVNSRQFAVYIVTGVVLEPPKEVESRRLVVRI